MRERNTFEQYENEIAEEIMHVSRRLFQRGTQMMENMNIGVGQVPILKLLKDNGTMTQRQIAEEIRVTPATICGTIKRMERAGLIRRASAERDGRVTCISLTDEGRERAEQAMAMIELSHRELMHGFSREELQQMQNFVRRMGENLVRAIETVEEEQANENR
jgi:DNA-binding MarR family transcriptional regulator